jgi:hypothetical protein
VDLREDVRYWIQGGERLFLFLLVDVDSGWKTFSFVLLAALSKAMEMGRGGGVEWPEEVGMAHGR